jgi:hypothetical protein
LAATGCASTARRGIRKSATGFSIVGFALNWQQILDANVKEGGPIKGLSGAA